MSKENALEGTVRWGLALVLILTGLIKLPGFEPEAVIPIPIWVLKPLALMELSAGLLMAMSYRVRTICRAIMGLCTVGGFLQLVFSGSCGCTGMWPLSPAGHLLLISALGLGAAWLFGHHQPVSRD